MTMAMRYSRFVFVFLIFSTWIFGDIQSQRAGFLYFKFLCYQNLEHLTIRGAKCDSIPSHNCDPKFIICISTQNIPDQITMQSCQIYYAESSPYDNEASVCEGQHDNRKSLRDTIKLELPSPMQNKFFIKIQIQDSDWNQATDLIATFYYDFSQTPAFNGLSPVYQDISMYRTDFRYANKGVSMKISMALQCERDFYGEHCLQFCRAQYLSNYKCSPHGRKICNEGWKGVECQEVDVCLYQSCAEGAVCIEFNKEAKCMCNGHMGPQCYPNHNPCLPNPCLNKAQCIPNKTHVDGFRCQCVSPFEGFHCENKIDICSLVPCHNNATCVYDNNYVRHCVCLTGYSGALCDYKNESSIQPSTYSPQNVKTGTVVALFVSFLLIIAIITVIFVVFFIRKRRMNLCRKNRPELAMNMGDLNKKANYLHAVSNDYVVKPTVETVYETVRDNETYAYLMEKNDDYLVPSRPATPMLPSSSRNGSNIYLDMLNVDESHDTDENRCSDRDNMDLPPLPTREQKNRRSFIFCVS